MHESEKLIFKVEILSQTPPPPHFIQSSGQEKALNEKYGQWPKAWVCVL